MERNLFNKIYLYRKNTLLNPLKSRQFLTDVKQCMNQMPYCAKIN